MRMKEEERKLPEFFKVYIPEHSSKEMKLPSEFTDYMGGRRSGLAQLTDPRGQTWQVELVSGGKELHFKDGWKVFVRDLLVEAGDFLFFTYLGNLKFSVTMYDETMCEKRADFRSRCSQEAGEQDGVTSKPSNVKSSKRNAGGSNTDLTHGSILLIPEGQKAGGTSAVKPSFVARMKAYNVRRHYVFNIPLDFVRENLESYRSGEKLVMRTDKETFWEVKMIHNNYNRYLSKGWAAFVQDNNIKEGDTCYFELLDRLEMKVHVSRETSK